jgi:hypothetical protein
MCLETQKRKRHLNKMHNLRVLWEDGKVPDLPKVNYFNLVEKGEEDSLKTTVLSLLKHGMAVVEQVL